MQLDISSSRYLAMTRLATLGNFLVIEIQTITSTIINTNSKKNQDIQQGE